MSLARSAALPERDVADQVDDLAEALLVEAGAGVVLGQHALERGVVALDRDHRVVHQRADGRLRGAGLQVRPARLLRHPEDVDGAVLVGVLRVGALRLLRLQLGVLRLEGVGDVLEEDQAEDDVLVLGRVHVVAQRVGGRPELGLEAEVGGGVAVLDLCSLPSSASMLHGGDGRSVQAPTSRCACSFRRSIPRGTGAAKSAGRFTERPASGTADTRRGAIYKIALHSEQQIPEQGDLARVG